MGIVEQNIMGGGMEYVHLWHVAVRQHSVDRDDYNTGAGTNHPDDSDYTGGDAEFSFPDQGNPPLSVSSRNIRDGKPCNYRIERAVA